MAQDSGPSSIGFDSATGFYIDGYVDLSYFDGDVVGSSETLFSTRLDLGFRPDLGSRSMALGFDLGIDGFSTDGFDEAAFYPAVSLTTGFGRFSAGIPRSVIDTIYIPQSDFAGTRALDLELLPFSHSYLGLVYLDSDETPYGVRYDGEFGNFMAGASWHRIDTSSQTVDDFAVAFRYTIPQVASGPRVDIFGGYEKLDVGSGNGLDIYKVGVQGDWDRFMLGAKYSNFGSSGGGDLNEYELYGSYNFTDQLSASADYLSLDFGGSSSTDVYGVGVKYKIAQGAYVDASYANVSGGGGNNDLYEVSIGWEF